MPRMDDAPPTHALIKALIIGDGKCGKTDWVARAAMAGFNILYLDGDVASATITNMLKEGRLSREAASRIYLLNMSDIVEGGSRQPRFYDTMRDFTVATAFRWNDSKSHVSSRSKDEEGDDLWEIKPGRLDHNCILAIDSWTSLTESMLLAVGNAVGVDIAEATTNEMRPVYQGAGLKATQQLQLIRGARCHVVVIGHPDEFTHMTKPEGRKVGAAGEKDMTIDWTKMIAKSTSKPHGLQMAKYFTDVFWLESNASGSERLIDARAKQDRVSGGHFSERKNTDDYSFANLVKAIGGSIPKGDQPVDHWITMSKVEGKAPSVLGKKIDSVAPAAEPTKILDGTTTTEVKTSGMAALMKKKAG